MKYRNVRHVRENYNKGELKRGNVASHPVQQFDKWFAEYAEMKENDFNAMILSTVKGDQPQSRVVLLKEFKEDGFVFYTNYNSAKGNEIRENPNVSLLFFWPELHRQVKVNGKARKIGPEKSSEYFSERPYDSRIAAIASPQSRKVKDRDELMALYKEIEKRYPEGSEVPRPESWGGYIVTVNYMEFWQGRPGRLHDRIVYEREGEEWNIFRLAP